MALKHLMAMEVETEKLFLERFQKNDENFPCAKVLQHLRRIRGDFFQFKLVTT